MIESDHNTIDLNCTLKFEPLKPQRVQIFNFKNEDCQKVFKENNNYSRKLTKSFDTNKPFLEQFKVFQSNLQSEFQKAFRKIRITKTKPRKETKGTWLQRKRKNLKIKIRLSKNETNVELIDEVQKIEEKLYKEAQNNIKEVKEMCKEF